MNDQEWIETTFDTLHTMPEEGFQEKRTAAFVAEQLNRLGFEVTTGIAGTGVVATLRGQRPGPVLALRADMDALSHNVNGQQCTLHSCGHDANMTMVLGAARIAARRQPGKGTLKLIFQPGEEKLPGGASIMIREGVLENPRPASIFGQHVHPRSRAPRLPHEASATAATERQRREKERLER